MPTPKVKTAQASAQKWAERAGGAATEYAEEALAAATDWENNTVNASANYKAAISAGDIDRRYSSGARRAGAAKYSRGVRDKGQGRYGGGVAAGQGDYESGVQPFLQVIAGTDLPARRPRGDAANRQRSERIQTALHTARLARAGAGR